MRSRHKGDGTKVKLSSALRQVVLGCWVIGAAAILLSACGGGAQSSSNEGSGSGETTASGEATGSGESSKSSDVTFGFSHPYAEVPVAATVKSMVQKDGEAMGWSVLLDQTKAGNIQEQTATIENWITQGISAIMILPPEPSAFEALAKRATEAGIIWTTYVEEMKEGAGGVTFPSDVTGRITGEATVKWINEHDPKAEVLILDPPPAPSLEDRTQIPVEMIEKETKATIVARQEGAEQAKGLQVTEDALQGHPGITVVVGTNDDGALGAAEAFRKNGSRKPSEVFIIGQDGSEDALNQLSDPNSYFRASAALNLKELAEEVVNVNARAIESGWEPGDEQEYVEIEPTLVENGESALIKKFLATFEETK